jgi:signal-transduction protein with cAMP-binding, CBS, and nucleotidyltransferase domain
MSTIADIMTRELKTVEAGTSVHSAARKMKEDRIGSLLVKQAAGFSGILTDTDLVRRAMASDHDLTKLTVEDVMTSPIRTIEDSRTVGDAQEMMGDLGVRHLGVTHGGKIVGVLSARDLLVYYQRYSEPKIAQD